MEDKVLKEYFMEFKRVQDMQIEILKNYNSFNNGSIINSTKKTVAYNSDLDLDTMIFERNRAFQNLRNAISLAPTSTLEIFKNEVANIIHKDEMVMKMLEDYKAELSKKIKQSAKGRQLLKIYTTIPTKSLRFMNNKI